MHVNVVTPGNVEPDHHGRPVPPPVGRIDIVARVMWLLRRLDRLERHITVLDDLAARDEMTGRPHDGTLRDRRDRARAALVGAEAVLADLVARQRKAQRITMRQDRETGSAMAADREQRFHISKDHARRLRKDTLATALIVALNAEPTASQQRLADVMGRPVDFVRVKLAKLVADGALIDTKAASAG